MSISKQCSIPMMILLAGLLAVSCATRVTPESTPSPTVTPHPLQANVTIYPRVTPTYSGTPSYTTLNVMLLTGQSDDCQFPCWRGLTPDQTNFEEFMHHPVYQEVLAKGRCVQYMSTESSHVARVCQAYRHTEPFKDGLPHAYFEFDDDSSSTMWGITLVSADDATTFRDIVSIIGTPPAMYALKLVDPHNANFVLGGQYYLLYPEKGLVIGSELPEYSWPCNCGDAAVNSISMRPQKPDDMSLYSWYHRKWFHDDAMNFTIDEAREHIGYFQGWGKELLPEDATSQ